MLLLTLLDFKHILKVFQCSSHVLINLHITSCNHHPHTDLIRQKSPESAKLPELSEVEKHCWQGVGFCCHVRSDWGSTTAYLLAFSSKETDSMKCNLYPITQTHQNKSTGSSSAHQLPPRLPSQTSASLVPSSSKRASPASPMAGENPIQPVSESFPSTTHTYMYNSVSCLANDSISYLRGQLPEADVFAK